MEFNSGFKGLNRSVLSTKCIILTPNEGLTLHIPVINVWSAERFTALKAEVAVLSYPMLPYF